MKFKKFGKKFVLNKKTIADLGNNELDKVKGGDPGTFPRTDCCEYPTQTIEPVATTCC